jgi:hypothetical protein
VTFTAAEIVAALIDKFPGEFSDQEMQGDARLRVAGQDRTIFPSTDFIIEYDSEVPQ